MINCRHTQVSRALLQLATVAILLTTTLATGVQAQQVYYRYVNNDGVKVLDNSIPPEYAQSGYEVLNSVGQVIKVVPPAPSEEDLEKNAAEREAREVYARLKRRFSSVDEIESAKQRRLANIKTNISILNGNISNLNNQIQGIMGKAATYERRGQPVPETVLQSLSDTRAELAVAEKLLNYREEEYQEVIEKYDQDIVAFARGETLEKQSHAEIK